MQFVEASTTIVRSLRVESYVVYEVLVTRAKPELMQPGLMQPVVMQSQYWETRTATTSIKCYRHQETVETSGATAGDLDLVLNLPQ